MSAILYSFLLNGSAIFFAEQKARAEKSRDKQIRKGRCVCGFLSNNACRCLHCVKWKDKQVTRTNITSRFFNPGSRAPWHSFQHQCIGNLLEGELGGSHGNSASDLEPDGEVRSSSDQTPRDKSQSLCNEDCRRGTLFDFPTISRKCDLLLISVLAYFAGNSCCKSSCSSGNKDSFHTCGNVSSLSTADCGNCAVKSHHLNSRTT